MMKSMPLAPDSLVVYINVRPELFGRRERRSFGKLNGLSYRRLGSRGARLKLGRLNLLFQQNLLEILDRIIMLVFDHFFVFPVTLWVAHGVAAVAIGLGLQEVGPLARSDM